MNGTRKVRVLAGQYVRRYSITLDVDRSLVTYGNVEATSIESAKSIALTRANQEYPRSLWISVVDARLRVL